MSVSITCLRSLVAFAETGSVNGAARLLSFSTSGVSRHIKILESVVGARLIRRTGNGSALTPEGEQCVEIAHLILDSYEKLGSFRVVEPSSRDATALEGTRDREPADSRTSPPTSRSPRSRAVVDQATGAIMAVHGISDLEALHVLTRHARASGVSVPASAEQLMSSVSRTGTIDAAATFSASVGSVRPSARSEVPRVGPRRRRSRDASGVVRWLGGRMADELPHPVQAVVDAINAADTDAFVGAFLADGVVDDWGRRFVGAEAVRGWSDAEAIGAGARMTPQEVTVNGEVVTVVATWSSRVFNGSSTFVFTLAGDRLAELRIPAH